MVAVSAAVAVAQPGQSAPPAWRLADGPVVPWTHETDLAARTVDPAEAVAASRSTWSLLGPEYPVISDDGAAYSTRESWWDDYRGAEIEHDRARARAALHSPGQRPARPLLGLLAHWIDRLFHPLRPASSPAECGPDYAVQFAGPEPTLPEGYHAGDQALPSSPFPQPLERPWIPAAPLPEPMPAPTPAPPEPPASELPVPMLPVEPEPAPEAAIEPPQAELPPAETRPTESPSAELPPTESPVPPNSLPQLPSLQPARPDFIEPMPLPSGEEPAPVPTAPSHTEPNQTEPRPLAPPANVLPLEQGTGNRPADAPEEPPSRRLGEAYPPVVELAPEPALPDLPAAIAPPPVEPAEPVLPANTIPRAPRLPKNAIPRSSR
jgi:hypothetical protein